MLRRQSKACSVWSQLDRNFSKMKWHLAPDVLTSPPGITKYTTEHSDHEQNAELGFIDASVAF